MRTECRQEKTIDLERIHGYHGGRFDKYGVFVSDRMTETDRYYRLPDGTILPVIGIEMETEVWGITNSVAYATILRRCCFSTFPENLWKIESDVTLNGGDCGAECITQPMTKAFIRNHYRDFKAMFETFDELGINNARTGNCGQHAHISLTFFGRTKKNQDEAIRKLYYIVNRHYDLILALLYRPSDRRRWCGRMDPDCAWTMDLESMDGDHANCFNGSHYRRGNIELRIPGGQANYPCFRNTMESIFHLIEASKTISRRDCEDVVKIFSGCNQHVFDRLRSYCRERGTISEQQLNAISGTVKRVDFR